MSHDFYENPLITRYASQEMSRIWSPQKKHSTWRRLWIALAEAQQELGLDISDAQLNELRAHVDNIDFEKAAAYEKQFRHDVMAHIHAYRDLCPQAGGLVHLGATSCYVTDNSELIQLKESLELVRNRLVLVIDQLATFAKEYRELACLGFTHLQPAQPTTVGKRATLWCYDLVLDLEEIESRLERLRFRGVKGTTGTQASFLNLFKGDHDKVRKLDELVTAKMGFQEGCAVTGQTYSRKVDAQILHALSGVGQSLHKFGTDMRILQHRREMEEPFGKSQVGSSAMAYKRNPMKSERICALSRFVISLAGNAEQTMATQWMERTLDDSANRRLSLPQAFLGTDAVLILAQTVCAGIRVYPQMIARHLQMELPFMATEEFLMEGVQSGGDRQELHEVIRKHSQDAADAMKLEGVPNDLISRLQNDPQLANVDLTQELDVTRYYGRAPEQVTEFLGNIIQPIRNKYEALLRSNDLEEEITV